MTQSPYSRRVHMTDEFSHSFEKDILRFHSMYEGLAVILDCIVLGMCQTECLCVT